MFEHVSLITTTPLSMRSSRSAAAAPILVILVLLTACGGGSGNKTPASSAETRDTGEVDEQDQGELGFSAPVEPGPIRYYECSSLLSDQEVQEATGLVDLTFLSQQQGGSVLDGQTACSFAAQGKIAIAAVVSTGESFRVFQETTEGTAVPGVGDDAIWIEFPGATTLTILGVRVGNLGLTITFNDVGGGGLGIADPKSAAVTLATLILPRL